MAQAQDRVCQCRWSTSHLRQLCSSRQRRWRSIRPAPAVISSPEPVVESIAPVPAVFQARVPLRSIFKGSNDAFDVHTSLTGYEPNDTVVNELVNSQGSFSYITPSSDLDIDDTTLGKLLTEAHREYADYRSPEGVSVSQSSLSVVSSPAPVLGCRGSLARRGAGGGARARHCLCPVLPPTVSVGSCEGGGSRKRTRGGRRRWSRGCSGLRRRS